jgi:hypothetical protein
LPFQQSLLRPGRSADTGLGRRNAPRANGNVASMWRGRIPFIQAENHLSFTHCSNAVHPVSRLR